METGEETFDSCSAPVPVRKTLGKREAINKGCLPEWSGCPAKPFLSVCLFIVHDTGWRRCFGHRARKTFTFHVYKYASKNTLHGGSLGTQSRSLFHHRGIIWHIHAFVT